MKPGLVDLFCGMGGASIGFHREGFDCTGYDITDVGYPYRLVLKDIRQVTVREIKQLRPSVIWASAPCTEYSGLTKLSFEKGQRGPPDPYGPKGLELVREANRIIQGAGPEYWIVENVWGSIPYISKVLGPPTLIIKPWVLWGNFPGFVRDMYDEIKARKGESKLVHSFENKHGNRLGLPEDFAFDPVRSWRRARIPVFLSQGLAKACVRGLRG